MPSPFTAAVPVGRLGPGGVDLLGTAFLLPQAGLLATASHVVGQDDTNLVVVFKAGSPDPLTTYQDTSDPAVQTIRARVKAFDAFRDLCVLEIGGALAAGTAVQGADAVSVGEELIVAGYPHANNGRMVLTLQRTDVGAKILIEAGGVKSKHLVLNVQARPGQSGSPVYRARDNVLVAVVVGSYAPGGGGAISLGGIDPHTLHQTTHAISAEYLMAMM